MQTTMRETSLQTVRDLVRRGGAALCPDSRAVKPGDVFVAITGSRVDGAAYIPAALEAGAGVIVSALRPEAWPDSKPGSSAGSGKSGSSAGQRRCVEYVVSSDPARDLGLLAQARFGTDRLPFPVIGVTGTNGKTTVTYLLEHLFAARGRATGVLGTVAYRWPGHTEEAPLTTPDTLHTHAMLAAMREAGVQGAFMEVSSHALDQRRVAGVPFSGAVFTNLTQDHLDYHETMEAYFAAKARLFHELSAGVMAINAGSEWGRRLIAELPGAIGYRLGQDERSDHDMLTGHIVENSPHGLVLQIAYKGKDWQMRTPLIGAFNAENLLAVQAVGLGFGFSPRELDVFENFYGVSGRLERVPASLNGREKHVFVDYAHTPDALVNVLQTLRGVGFPRIITVFGCGGNRDRTKRPLMGKAVAELSDVAVLTSDNPRHEDPTAIMDDVMPGLRGGVTRPEIHAEPDRRAAIALALSMAGPDDVVLIAGKGHEPYQQIGDTKYPFSDQAVVRELAPCK